MAQAVQSNPDNEELAMDAFIQYLRVNDQKAAQQVCRFLLLFPGAAHRPHCSVRR